MRPCLLVRKHSSVILGKFQNLPVDPKPRFNSSIHQFIIFHIHHIHDMNDQSRVKLKADFIYQYHMQNCSHVHYTKMYQRQCRLSMISYSRDVRNKEESGVTSSSSSSPSFGHNRHYILICHNMIQSNSLGHMSCACPPYHGVLKSLFERPVHLVTDIFDGRVVSND